jgi:hypothetical protein
MNLISAGMFQECNEVRQTMQDTIISDIFIDLNACCPYQDHYGGFVTSVTWETYKQWGYFRTIIDSEVYTIMISKQEVIEWADDYPVLVEKRWTVASEVLHFVLIPEIVKYVVEGYIVPSRPQ